MDRKIAKQIVAAVMPRYCGGLTASDAEVWKTLAVKNAKRLLSSAKLLLKSGDSASALSLAVLAVEEHGKIEIIDCILKAGINTPELKTTWDHYRTHTSKTSEFISMYAELKGASEGKACDFQMQNEDLLPLFDLMKQLGFYSDCTGNARWHDPHCISPAIAIAVVSAAEKIISGAIQPDFATFLLALKELKSSSRRKDDIIPKR